MVNEAQLERTEYGMTPVTDGWFVVSVPDAAWMTNERLACPSARPRHGPGM